MRDPTTRRERAAPDTNDGVMNSPPTAPTMSTEPEPAPFPRTFVILSFAAAILVAVIVIYFGVNGQLGAGIP